MNESLLRDLHDAQIEEIAAVKTAIKELAERPSISPADIAKIEMMLSNIKLPEQDFSELKQYMQQLAGRSATATQVAQIDQYIRKSVVPIVDSYNDWCELVKNFVEAQLNERKPQTLIHKFDLSSWGVLVVTFVLITMCLVLCIFAYSLKVENHSLRVNDLKYRYIRMVGDINDSLVCDLEESIFNDKSGKILNEIEHQVNDYERAIELKIRAEEQAKLRAAEAAKLDKQIDELKHK